MPTPSVSRLIRRSAIIPLSWLALTGTELLAEQERRATTPGVVAVVGRWSDTTSDGEPVVLVEDSREQTRTSAEIAPIASSLFTRRDPAFVANATAAGAFSLGVLEQPQTFAGGTFRARFKLVSGATDQTAGLVFDLRPSGEYAFVRYNTKDGNVALWRYRDGARERIADGEALPPLRLNVWHELTLTITGMRLVGTLNGVVRLEHTLTAPIGGRVGFWAKRDSVTMFKDVAVTP